MLCSLRRLSLRGYAVVISPLFREGKRFTAGFTNFSPKSLITLQYLPSFRQEGS